MDSLDQKIRQKKAEIATLSQMLDNAKKDLRVLENLKKREDTRHVV